jgi:tetratricopeptide (TPR) repeat protein
MLSTPARAQPPSCIADFTSPLTLPGGTVSGAELVRELPADVALPVWHTLRSVLLWSQVPPGARAALFEDGAMEAWEAEVLTGTLEESVRSPLAVLARELSTPEEASPQQIAWACFCVTEWALGRRATATAMVFAETAALAWPEHPRYAWAAGRLMRTHGKLRDAETWMRRAIRLSVQCADWQMQILGLNSLGNVLHEAGRNPEAVRVLTNGLRIARRHRQRDAEGELLHDLLVVSVWGGDLDDAERYARLAGEIYQDGHPKLAAFAHDVTFLWLKRGNYAGALEVMRKLLTRLDGVEDRLRVLASAVRAAGGCGAADVFEEMWTEAVGILDDARVEFRFAGAIYELGLGAAGLGRWTAAENMLRRAHAVACARGEMDVIVRSEAALESVRLRQAPEPERTTADEQGRLPLNPLVSRFADPYPRETGVGR